MQRLKPVLLPLLAFLGFAGIALITTEAYRVLEFDTDEGINLMKALLYSRGFSLYGDIWNDQPPLFTVLLSLWFKLVGSSIVGGRLLVLGFASVLVWAFYQIINLTVGKLPAIASTLLLIGSWLFIRLSVSVMIGLPSLAVALLSLYCLIRYQKDRQLKFLIGSGIFLALSLQIKLISIFLVPIAAVYLFSFKLFDPKSSEGRSLKSAFLTVLIWLVSVGLTYLITALLFQSFHPEQLIQIHVNERAKSAQQNYNDLRYLMRLLREDPDYLYLTGLGVIAAAFSRKYESLLPIAWLSCAFLLLATHNPVWYHHYLLVSIPIIWLSAYAIAIAVDAFKTKQWYANLSLTRFVKLAFSSLTVLLLIVALVGVPERLERTANDIPVQDQRVLNRVMKYKDQTRWILTDRPVYAFYAGLPVPPQIAVMSRKRFNSGLLTFEDLLNTLKTYQPEQIILAKYNADIEANAPLRRYIRQNYVRTYRNKEDPIEHYVSRQIWESVPRQESATSGQ
jgi:4-amino-4-deoxy-L-arabinose transferase-like glycosyltransferase